VLVNAGLWDMVFGGGGGANNDPGAVGTLYITAGGSAGQPNFPAGGSATAVFASVVPVAAVGAPGFSLNLSAMKRPRHAGRFGQLNDQCGRGRRIQQSDCAYLLRAHRVDLRFLAFNDLFWIERVILHIDHLCRGYTAGGWRGL